MASGTEGEAEVWKLVSSFREAVADQVDVKEQQLTDRLRSISFQPTNPDAAPIWLAISQWSVVVQIGKGTRFELGVEERDRHLLDDLLRAAAAGRVEETTRRLWLAFRVSLSDGTVRVGRVMGHGYGGKRATRRYAPWLPSSAPSG